MFAVVRTGGKQYRVAPDGVIRVERLKAAAGETIELDEVLAMGDGETVSLGRPLVDGARVAATVVEHTRGEKVIVFRKKRRKNHRRKRGHRQELTVLRIDEILAAGQERQPPKGEEEVAADAKPAAGTKTRKRRTAKAGSGAKPRKRTAAQAETGETAAPTEATAEAAAEEDAQPADAVAGVREDATAKEPAEEKG